MHARVSLNLVHTAAAASSPSHLSWSEACVVSPSGPTRTSTTTTDAPLTATTVDERCAELTRAALEVLRTISQYAKNGVTEAESDLGTAAGELDTARLNFQNGNFSFAMTTLDGAASAIGGAESSIASAKTALATLQDTMNSAARDAEDLHLLTNQQPDQAKQRRYRIG
jgi:hypothetical protein